MKRAGKTRQELADDIAALKKKVRDLQRSEAMSKLADAGLQQEHALFLEMINTQPAGIYRIRVFPRRKWRQNAWNAPEAAPYSVELASERFCEILGITRDVFEHTPGIVEEMVYPEDRAEFARKNIEANTLLVPFQWEGRMNVGDRTIWAHFESLPRPVANGDVIWTGFLHDITGRKAAEEALVRSEASLRQEQSFNHLLLNNTSALIVAMDLDGKTLMMNKALLNALEYTEEEVRGADYLATFVPEADREMVAVVFRKIVHEGMATVNENRIVSRSGKTFLVEWHGGIAKQEAGVPGFFVGVGIDISGRKKAEQELHESEQRLKLLSDNLPGGLVYQIDSGVHGYERRFTYVSAGIEALHGVSAEQTLRDASVIYSQVDPTDAKLVAEREARALAAMAPFSVEVRVHLPSGETRWRLFTSAPRRAANGHLIWDGIEVDITDSKRTEEESGRSRS
jgi:PAS domain S-box-containing protein